MTVLNSWLVETTVNINTFLAQGASFQDIMVFGIFDTSPSSWGSALYKSYSSVADVISDFAPLQSAATNPLQQNRYLWLIQAATDIFTSAITPETLYLGKIPTPAYGVAFNFITAMQNVVDQFNGWIPCMIADEFAVTNSTTGTLSSVVIDISVTVSGAETLPSGWSVSGSVSPSPAYTLTNPFSIPSTGNYTVTLNSQDVNTAIPAASLTTPVAVSGVTFNTTTQPAAATLGVKQTTGFLGSGGLIASLSALANTTNNNAKICFMDSNNIAIAQGVQAAAGSKYLMICFHSYNFDASTDLLRSLSARTLQTYFGNIFTAGVPLKIAGNMQLGDFPIDPIITTSNIGRPGQTDTSLYIPSDNNVYAGFGGNQAIGLFQYGLMSSSVSNQLVYLDQVVGAVFIDQTVSNGLFTFLISKNAVGGLEYSDNGIQELLAVYRSLIQVGVVQKIIQQPKNSDFSYYTYAQVLANDPGNIADRIYSDLSFNGHFLSRIQRLQNTVNLSL